MDWLGIESLEIDPHIEEKLWVKHGLRFVEVEQALADEDAVVVWVDEVIREVYGLTSGGRHLLVVLAEKGGGRFKVVTAFPMNRRQIRWYESRRR